MLICKAKIMEYGVYKIPHLTSSNPFESCIKRQKPIILDKVFSPKKWTKDKSQQTLTTILNCCIFSIMIVEYKRSSYTVSRFCNIPLQHEANDFANQEDIPVALSLFGHNE